MMFCIGLSSEWCICTLWGMLGASWDSQVLWTNSLWAVKHLCFLPGHKSRCEVQNTCTFNVCTTAHVCNGSVEVTWGAHWNHCCGRRAAGLKSILGFSNKVTFLDKPAFLFFVLSGSSHPLAPELGFSCVARWKHVAFHILSQEIL